MSNSPIDPVVAISEMVYDRITHTVYAMQVFKVLQRSQHSPETLKVLHTTLHQQAEYLHTQAHEIRRAVNQQEFRTAWCYRIAQLLD